MKNKFLSVFLNKKKAFKVKDEKKFQLVYLKLLK